MTCLLIAATAREIQPYLDDYRTRDKKKDIDILITGVGLTAATYSLTKQIAIKRPAIIIQAGIAGCFNTNIPLGSVVVVKKETIGDQSVIEQGQLSTMFDLGLIQPNRFPFKKGWLVNGDKELLKHTKLRTVTSISVNHVTTSREMISFYHEKFQPDLESMEGAALHYVSLFENIQFLQIRSISNYIGERDKKYWKIKNAIVNLNEQIIRMTNNF